MFQTLPFPLSSRFFPLVCLPLGSCPVDDLMVDDADTGTDRSDQDPLGPPLNLQGKAELIEGQMAQVNLKGTTAQEAPHTVQSSSQRISLLPLHDLGKTKGSGRCGDAGLPVLQQQGDEEVHELE